MLVASQEYAKAALERTSAPPEAQSEPISEAFTPSSPYAFHRVLTPTPTTAATILGNSSPRFRSIPEGSQLEVSPASYRMARQVGFLLSQNKVGGAGLIVDYGGDRAYGDSFRVNKNIFLCRGG